MTCRSCAAPLPHDSSPRRLYCGTACRSRAFRERDTAHRAEAHALILKQTAAIIAGDFTALAEVQRDAARLFSTTS